MFPKSIVSNVKHDCIKGLIEFTEHPAQQTLFSQHVLEEMVKAI